LFLEQHEHWSIKELHRFLNKECGLKGISGLSSDVRDLWQASKKGNKKAKLALDMLAYRILLFVGAYMSVLNGVDVIVFTGGIGEHAWYIRKNVLDNLRFAGLVLDNEKNRKNKTIITKPNSKIKVMVVPTNEELQIALETEALIKKSTKKRK
jgi:acetate kinase